MKTVYFIIFATLSLAFPASGQDLIEFLNGTDLKGKVIKIHKADREVEFEALIAGKTETKRYPYTTIHAVTWKGKRYVVTKKKDAPPPKDTTMDPEKKRTVGEVRKLIADVGSTDPDWLAETELRYPDSLDLDWPEPAPKPWNNRKNMGQFIWDVVNPNQSRWREGVKLMMHLLETRAKKKGEYRTRVRKSLGGMYFRFFQDYPRAAYWWEQAGAKPGGQNSEGLAECYWRMGNQSMAEDMLETNTLRLGKIKLLGAMGETREALKLVDTYARLAKEPHQAYLLAGDIMRREGKFPQALKYYNKVLELPRMKNESYDNRNRSRAQESLASIKQFQLLDLNKVPDGTYNGSSMGYEGPVEVAVTVQEKKIVNVEVTKHKEKQFYSAIDDTTRQIVAKQDLKDVDTTSRATITSAAIVNGAAKALAGARQ